MPVTADADRVLRETSRTFSIPISQLPDGLRETVTSAYLMMRAIDEVEDGLAFEPHDRTRVLLHIARTLQGALGRATVEFDTAMLAPGPEVTRRIAEWAALAPAAVAPHIWEATSGMAYRMADWTASAHTIETESDLDAYTFSVAGAVGLLLSNLWAWHDATLTSTVHAIGFGRGLQSVNMLVNRADDLERGVDFYPRGWDYVDMRSYAGRHLALGDIYLSRLNPGPIREFCRVPLALAHGTLRALDDGRSSLTRAEVVELTAYRRKS
ncbi:squalene/phytoene synthase family protein [Actinomadura hibisca]|uniref:squalene/phytoene synthase family protein n=1 Tax=Actinomadura hibisca TaxID=68565 RepID=UPI0008343781|nr:squalene/phytoene synthase family protein [Actinomadura hibisca]